MEKKIIGIENSGSSDNQCYFCEKKFGTHDGKVKRITMLYQNNILPRTTFLLCEICRNKLRDELNEITFES